MTLQYYIGGKITGLAADTKPLGVPEFTTFIESDTFTEFILVSGVWERIGTVISVADLVSYNHFNAVSTPDPNSSTDGTSLGTSADFNNVTNVAFGAVGQLGEAVEFNGTNAYGNLGTSTSQWDFLTWTSDTKDGLQGGRWTINVWLKFNNLTGEQIIFDSRGSSSNNVGLNWIKNPNNTFNLQFSGGSGNNIINFITSDAVPDTNYHFYSITWDVSLVSNNLSYRRDNANEETGNKVANGFNITSGKATLLGRYATLDLTSFLNGRMDELSIFRRILSDDERTILWNNGVGIVIE